MHRTDQQILNTVSFGWSCRRCLTVSCWVSDLLNSFSTIIQSNEVASLHIKAIKVLHCSLCIVDIFINNKSSSFLFCCFAFPDLPDRTEPTEHIVQFLSCYFVWKVSDEDDLVDFGCQPDILRWSFVAFRHLYEIRNTIIKFEAGWANKLNIMDNLF